MGSALDLSGGVDELYRRRSNSDLDAIRGDWETVGRYLDTVRRSVLEERDGTPEAVLLSNVEASYRERRKRSYESSDEIEALLVELIKRLSETEDKDRVSDVMEALKSALHEGTEDGENPNQLELALDNS
jgi:hypothetical protein